ncbi:MAG: hypothetical protein EPO45_04235 [Sphingobium sp.]|nr:MAG: hypothetical protein EPO45_04235 [Sphingobium sp.]
MTTNQPVTPEPQSAPFQFGYDAWIAEDAKRRAAFAEELVGLKTNLFDLLEAQGIVLVTVTFDGCGDSGQIEDIVAFDEHGEVAVPEDKLASAQTDTDAAGDAEYGEPIKDVIETLAYDLLQSEHGGWENNEGAYGEFRFDVADRTITLGCNIRISSADYSETSW